jgi:hypothetical protein
LSIHSHKPLTLTAYYLTRAKHRENTIQRPIWVDRYNWQSGLANGWFWPVPVIGITENYSKHITAYCAAPALRLWLWLIAGVGQKH